MAVNFVISRSDLEALDDWCFKARIRSRSEAIRMLISEGIKNPPPPRAKTR